MRYLTSALLSEGATDERFLPPLLARMLEEICGGNFDQDVEVAPVLPLRGKSGPRPIPELLRMVEETRSSFELIFFHHDQGTDERRVRDEWLDPLRSAWGSRSERLVTVVPVRETEAWLLADGEALRVALGVTWSDAEMGLPPSPKQVEGLADPKLVLKKVTNRVSRAPGDHFAQLGELVSLERLALVPAYSRLRTATHEALVDIGFR